MADVPHFSIPFRFGGPPAAVVEQDSIEEIAGCVLTILLCPLGYRPELPDFGTPDQTFATPQADLDVLRAVIDTWEPRAAVLLTQERERFDELVDRLQVLVRVRTAT